MKKVLALVLTLSMLVGTLAVGLSAAFEFTTTEDGEKFENVYSLPLESTAGRVTYFNVKGPTTANRNLRFDLWFEKADGGIGLNFGGDNYPFVRTDRIGLKLGAEEKTIPFQFNLMQKYDVQLRTGGAPSGQTNVIIDGVTIGVIDGQLPGGADIYCGASGILMDNIRLTDGLDTQAEIDFDGTYRGGDNYEDCDKVTQIEFRHDLGKKYGVAGTETYTFAKVGENWKNEDGTFEIEFDINFISNPSTQNELKPKDNGPWITNTKIGVGVNAEGQNVDYSFQQDEWYHVKYVSLADKTEIYVNGVKVEGTFPAMSGVSINDQGYCFWPEFVKMDNLRVGKAAVIDFEADNWADVFEGNGFTQAEYVGKAVDIWEKIETSPVEGEAVILKAGYNSEKNPTPETPNWINVTEKPTYTAESYIVNFDLALYPDQENVTNFKDKYDNGTWIEFILNKMEGGDNDRVKFGDKFVGKNKDLWYYGEDVPGAPEAVKTMQPWAPGEFHNVTIYVANGTVKLYIDKQEVYSAVTGMKYFDDCTVWYVDNGSAVIDNYKVYDKDFKLQDSEFTVGDGESHFGKIADVKAEGAAFCEANGHINYWARKTDPKCYEEGTNTYTCHICGATEDKNDVPKLEHNFQGYDINRVEEDENGNTIVYSKCTKSSGCPEKKFVVLPKEDAYTGTFTMLHDFTDDMMAVQSSTSEIGFIFEDGVGRYIDSNHNYNRIKLGTNMSSSELNAGFTIGFDFTYNGTYDTGDTTSYGHLFALNVGKQALGSAQFGYNADTETFFLRSYSGAFSQIDSDPFPLIPGETYNFEVKSYTPEVMTEMPNTVLALYVNGVKVVEWTGAQAWMNCKYEEGQIDSFFFWNYGVAFDMDNFHIASYDFAWNREYQGDVDGDYCITVEDAALMRQYLAKIIDESGLAAISRADVNLDGSIDAKDQLRIRKHLAGI